MKKFLALLLLLAFGSVADASTVYGTLNNFDVINDTGVVCHGFEIELDGVHSTDITYTYDYNHYGTPKIREDNTDPANPKVFIRYASLKDSLGHYTAFTAIPPVPIAPTDGHQCTNPGVNLGCEHFGVGNYGAAIAKYNWLVDDGAGNLIHGPAVNIAAPAWVYFPPVGVQPAQVQAVIVAPPPPEVIEKEFGDAIWVKSIVTTSHNNQPLELRDLVSDDPDNPADENWQHGEPDEVEIEWQIMQKEFAHPGAGNDELAGGAEDLPDGDEVVTRRYEFYKYAGPYDPETNEVVCDSYPPPADGDPDCLAPVELLGDYIGAQMAGFDAEAALGLIDHLQDGVQSEPYPDRTVVVGGNAPFVTTITLGDLPNGLTLDSASGILSGTPTEAGAFTFTVHATDFDGLEVSRAYALAVEATDTTAPVTTAVFSPAPNLGGWNNSDVTVTGTATDEVGGSGVSEITYSVAGAFTVPPTPTPGSVAAVVISAEGTSTVTFFATDVAGNAEVARDFVVMLDKTAPLISPPADQTVGGTGPGGAVVMYPEPAVADKGSGVQSAGCLPASGSVFPFGETTVLCTATDFADNTATSTFTVTVTDLPANAAPQCDNARPSLQQLWGANHGLAAITILGVTDADDPVNIRITGIRQDEMTSGLNTAPGADLSADGAGTGTAVARIRAERLATGNGRVYYISYEARDPHGASCAGTVLVGVPVSQRVGPAMGDGAVFDSTVP